MSALLWLIFSLCAQGNHLHMLTQTSVRPSLRQQLPAHHRLPLRKALSRQRRA